MIARSCVLLTLACALAGSVNAQFVQQGGKLVGTGEVGNAELGNSVALSADGNTAIVGGPGDNGNAGAAWVYTRSGGVWTQQGGKLVGTGAVAGAYQGWSVALSGDGNTAIVGGPSGNVANGVAATGVGAAWVYTRSGGVWTQQGNKLVAADAVGNAGQGTSVALSSDGNTAIVGGFYDSGGAGAVWVYTRSGGVWAQQGSKLVGTGAVGGAYQGYSVALSGDGNTAILGGPLDNGSIAAGVGAAWVYTRSGGVWTQQGGKLVGTGAIGGAIQGVSVALSSDGNTALVGGPNDNHVAGAGSFGAAWVYARSGGVWTQQGSKLVGTGAAGSDVGQGTSAALSTDGNTAIVGGPQDNGGLEGSGAAWVFTRSGNVWTQQGSKLVGTGAVGGGAQEGTSVALSGDGNTAIVGGPVDNGAYPSGVGAAWVFGTAQTAPAIAVAPSSLGFAYTVGGTIPAAQSIQVTNSGGGTLNWSAATSASWLSVAPASGTAPSTLSVLASPAGLGAGTYTGSVQITAAGASNSPVPVTVTLTVAAAGAVLAVSPHALTFNYTVGGGAPATQGISITNAGGGTLSWIASASAGWVGLSSASGTAPATLSVSVSPATLAAASYSATVLITAAGATGSPASVSVTLVVQTANAQFVQQGSKLVGSGAAGNADQGWSVALSSDGNTAIVGGPPDSSTGAVWAYTRSGGVWTQQGSKLVGTGAVGGANQGWSVALSADGNTAIVGGWGDNNFAGAAWVFTRSGGVWTQQGGKLVGTGAVGYARQGISVALSADGNTAVVGGCEDNRETGAAWVYTRSAGVWTQQGSKLVGTSAAGNAEQGWSVALSSDGNTALVGGWNDNNSAGAVWVYTRSGGVWTQQGSKLVGTGAAGNADQGWSVALSSDGNTALVGGDADNSGAGAAWVYTRSAGVWTQQGSKLVGTGASRYAQQGYSVALSGDGNTAIVGGCGDNGDVGAAWVYTRSAGVWTQQGGKLVGTGASGDAYQGISVALSGDGNTVIVGGPYDNNSAGAVWVFGTVQTAVNITVTTSSLPSGTVGVAYSQTLSASGGTPPYTNWTVSVGSLPPGLSLNASSGVISGTPSSATGSPFGFSITVRDSVGDTSAPQALSIAVNLPTPTISSLSPNSAAAGGPTLTLMVSGAGFVPASTAQWNGSALSTTFVSATQLTASVPANLIASPGTANVTVVNPGGVTSNTVTFTIVQFIEAAIPLPEAIADVDVNPNTNRVYVGGNIGNVVQAMVWIDGNTNQIVKSLGPGQGLHVNPVTNKIYAADLYGGDILVYSGTDGSLLKTISTFGCPIEAVVDSSLNHIWGGGQCGGGNDPAFLIDGSTDTVVSGYLGSGGVMGGQMAVNPVTHAFYVLVSGSVEKKVNSSTLAVTNAPFSAALVAVNPQTSRMYGADPSGKNVLVVDATTESLVATLAVSQPGAIAVNPTRNRVYAVDFSVSPQAIRVFDGGTNTLVGNIPLRPGDQACCGMAVNSSTGKIYLPVSNLSSQLLLVIDDSLGTTQCSGFYSISPTSVSVTHSTTMITDITVTAPNGCAWTAVSNVSWLTILSGSGGAGNGTVSSSAASNTTASPRTGTLTIAGQTFTVTQAGQPILSVSPSTLSFSAAQGGSNPSPQVLSLSTSDNSLLVWTATASTTSGGNWLSISPTSGLPPGPISVSVNIAGLAQGTYNGTVRVASDGAGNSPQSIPVTLIVGAAPAPSITTSSVPNGTVGVTYSQTLSASGGTPPYSNWTVSAGSLPPGLSLNASSGAISGTPSTAVGSPFSFSVTVRDSVGNISAPQALAITINVPTPTVSSLSPNSAIAGGPAFTLTVSGSGFVPGSTAQWNGSALSTVFVSATQLTASVPANLTASPGTANVAVVNPGGATSNPVTFTILPSSGPAILPGGVVNGASFAKAPAPVAPGSIVAIFGTALASGTASATTIPLPKTMQNSQVLMNGIAAPLFYVSPSQINAQVPWEVSGASSLSVQVTSGGAGSNLVSVPAAPAAPGVFGAGGGSRIVHASDSTLVTASNPAAPGEYLTVYCTGLGVVTNPPATGAAALSSPLSSTTVIPTVTIAGNPATVSFSGLTPGSVGLYQVNVQVPGNVVTASAAPLVLSSGGNSTAAAIAVQSDVLLSSTQFVSAAQGGSITLPNGSGVTIAPGALALDQTVTLQLVTTLSQQPPSGLITGVGPALVLSFSDVTNQERKSPADSSRPAPQISGSSSTPNFEFQMDVSGNTVTGLQGSAPMADLIDTTGTHNFIGIAGGLNAAGSAATFSIPATIANIAGNAASSIAVSLANLTTSAMAPSTTLGARTWNGTAFVPSLCPDLSQSSGNVLVLVHGMASSVEKAFPCCGNIEAAGGYGAVTGFDYNWQQGLNTSGSQLANYLKTLVTQCSGITHIDIEAHSEGVPVSLSAVGQSSPQVQNLIQNLISLGGPIMGTPAGTAGAGGDQALQTVLQNVTPSSVAPFGPTTLSTVLNSVAFAELTTGSSTLAGIRQNVINATTSKTLNMKIIAVAGNVTGLPSLVSDSLAPLFPFGFDGVIGVDSALGTGSGLNISALPAFADSHTQLECGDPNVIQSIGSLVRGTGPLPPAPPTPTTPPQPGTYAGTCTAQGTPVTCCGADGQCVTVPAPSPVQGPFNFTLAPGTSLSQFSSQVCASLAAALGAAGCAAPSCYYTAATGTSATFTISCTVPPSSGCTPLTVNETCSATKQ
jgi:uncharacterized protein (TIGR03437 family)